ncbi:thiamine pyrophosphate-binding protein [Spirillospora sp. NPDC048911]|uniref:thiamine pyrophosphate-binding protein n=1 Tax=Spirillospora sp. NPDC048911 TaxID=3364527 RepID=UPI0037105C98
MNPSAALLEILRDEGVTRVFGNPGTTELPLLEALASAPGLEYVLGLHEGPAVAMADGYARATGRPAFVSLHAAAGVANGLIGLLNAARSRTPLVAVAGQQDRRHLIQDPMLSGDLTALASPAVKYAIEVHQAYDLPVLLRRAFALAVRPPAGPVLLSLPMDVLEGDEDVPVPARTPAAVPGSAPADEIERAAALLERAHRPVIIAGDGVGRAGAMDDLVAIAERLGAAVYHQPMFDALSFPCGHALYAGALPPRNTLVREALQAYDTLLLTGCRAFTPHHYTPGSPIPDGLTVVQADADPAEIGRNFPAHAGLAGDLRGTLRALAERLPDEVPAAKERLRAVTAESADRRTELDRRARAAYGPAPLAPLAAAHAIAAALPPGAVLIEEAITVGVLLRGTQRLDRPGSYVHTVGGGLGWGIGAAIGTRLAVPSRPVIAVLGDGSATFGLQGLWTAARYGLPVLFLVMNNGEYRTLKDTLDERGHISPPYAGLDLCPPALDWLAAARLFGVEGRRVGSAAGLAELVAAAPRLPGPLLAEVPITAHPGR